MIKIDYTNMMNPQYTYDKSVGAKSKTAILSVAKANNKTSKEVFSVVSTVINLITSTVEEYGKTVEPALNMLASCFISPGAHDTTTISVMIDYDARAGSTPTSLATLAKAFKNKLWQKIGFDLHDKLAEAVSAAGLWDRLDETEKDMGHGIKLYPNLNGFRLGMTIKV